MNKNKNYDCVAEARKIRQQIQEETKNMTPEEELKYYKEHSKKNPLWKKLTASK